MELQNVVKYLSKAGMSFQKLCIPFLEFWKLLVIYNWRIPLSSSCSFSSFRDALDSERSLSRALMKLVI